MDWKDALGALYDASPEEEKIALQEQEETTAPTKKQHFCLQFQRRNGKPATLITGFEGSDDELKELAKQLKVTLGVGGSARGGEILIQGDKRDAVLKFLTKQGYKARII